MLKCWSEEPEPRPSFSALAKTFERMENDTSVCISMMIRFPLSTGLFPNRFVRLRAVSHRCVFIFEYIGFPNFLIRFSVDGR